MDNPKQEVLTIEDVAEFLRIPRSSAYKLVQEGKIPGKKVGRHWRFHRQALSSWLQTTDTPQAETKPTIEAPPV